MKSKLESLFFAVLTGLVIAGTTVLAFAGIVVLAAASSAVVGALLYVAWNYAAIPVFGTPRVTFLQMWALWFIVATVLGALRRARSAR